MRNPGEYLSKGNKIRSTSAAVLLAGLVTVSCSPASHTEAKQQRSGQSSSSEKSKSMSEIKVEAAHQAYAIAKNITELANMGKSDIKVERRITTSKYQSLSTLTIMKTIPNPDGKSYTEYIAEVVNAQADVGSEDFPIINTVFIARDIRNNADLEWVTYGNDYSFSLYAMDGNNWRMVTRHGRDAHASYISTEPNYGPDDILKSLNDANLKSGITEAQFTLNEIAS